jgi:hypothetical protein
MFSKQGFYLVLILLLFGLLAATPSPAQSKKKSTKKAAATAVKPAETKSETKAEGPKPAEPQPDPIAKRNNRPSEETPKKQSQNEQANAQTKPDPLYSYEFTQPDFLTSRILIEHDEQGKGTIAFERRGNSETFTEPISVSESVLAKLNAAFTELNFLDSTEDYQHEKDFSHMGNSKITLTRGQKTRSVTLNYTLNKSAKVLMDEYRKISNQALWIFDITVARESQPLDGPSQMDALDGLLRRGEIADPKQMLPFLRELSDDERLPLIARNHATRLAQQIEKAKK